MTWRSLICDVKTDPTDPNGPIQSFVSLGRITFWLLMGFMCYFWIQGIPVPSTLGDTFGMMVLYNFLKKPLEMIDKEAVKTWITKN